MTERRYVSIWMPHFAFDRRARRERDDQQALGRDENKGRPTALVAEGPRGPVIHALDAAGRAAGLRVGARAADMRALRPDLVLHPADPEGDARALAELALWARRWCPWTAAEPPGGIALDVTGAEHLSGGPGPLLAEMEARLKALGFEARAAAAPCRAAAWALARFGARGPGEGPPVAAAEGLEAMLAPLPIQALRLGPEAELALRRLGLGRVGDLAALPRPALARRFGAGQGGGRGLADLLARLDRLRGLVPEPMEPAPARPRLYARLRLPAPMMDARPHLLPLARDLCRRLAGPGLGLRRARLEIYRADGEARAVEAGLDRPSRDPERVLTSLRARLDALDAGPGFDLLILRAAATEPLAPERAASSDGEKAGILPPELIGRLRAGLGAARPARPAGQAQGAGRLVVPPAGPLLRARPGHRAGLRLIAGGLERAASGPILPAASLARPRRLLDPPEEVRVLQDLPDGPPARLLWRRQALRVLRHEGPERAVPGWWPAGPGARVRDHFRIEVEDGRRFWIYRDGPMGDGPGEPPRWFLQGLLA